MFQFIQEHDWLYAIYATLRWEKNIKIEKLIKWRQKKI